MRRYSTVILLFLTLLAVSRSAPSPKPDPSKDEDTTPKGNNSTSAKQPEEATPQANGSDPASPPTQAATNSKASVSKASMSIAQLIHKIKPVFDGMSLETLTQLSKASGSGKIEEFEGILMELYDEEGTEDVFTLIENLKNHFEIVPGMLRGAIFKKQEEIRKTQTPTKPNEQEAAGNKQEAAGNKQEAAGNKQEAAGNKQEAAGNKQEAADNKQEATGNKQEASNKENIPQDSSQVDSNIEKIVLKDLIKALDRVPPKTLKRIVGAIVNHAGADPIKQLLTKLQKETAHDLSDELINYASIHLMDLKGAIEVILETREAADSVIVPSSAAKKNGTIPATTTAEKSAKEDSQPTAAPSDEKTDENKDEVSKPVEDDEPAVPDDKVDTAAFDENPVSTVDLDDIVDESNNDLPEYLYEPGEEQETLNNAEEDENNNKPDVPSEDEKMPPQKTKTKLLGENSPGEEGTSSGGGGGWFGMWHFLIIFLVIAGIVGTVYVCSHNRKKIREGVGAYIADAASRGRRNRNYRYKPVSS